MSTKDELGPDETQSSAARSRSAASVDLDDLDAAILRFLQRNGRATNFEVGEAVGLSASAASRRIQSLEAAGVIRGEVRDRSSALPKLNPTPDHSGGFGLGIVSACTARWGAVANGDGKEVWFEIDQ